MSGPGRRIERLRILAQSLGVTEDYPGVHLTAAPLPTPSPEEIATADTALNEARLERWQSKSHFCGKPSTSAYNAKEATLALDNLVARQTCKPGEAVYLLQKGANVNYSRRKSESMWKRMKGRDQEDVRSTALRTVTLNRTSNGTSNETSTGTSTGTSDAISNATPNVHLINVLSSKADQAHCDEALGIALSQRDLGAMRILLLAGANVNLYAIQVRQAVRTGDLELVRLLCSGKTDLSEQCATDCLLDAVLSGQLMLVRLMLWRRANADIQDPSPITNAVQSSRRDIVAALCLTERHPSPHHLARVIASLCAGIGSVSSDTLSMVEILLAAGAEGEPISQAIVEATKQGHLQLVSMLVSYSSFDAEQSPQALRSAASAGDVPLFGSLISMSLPQVTVDDIVEYLQIIRGDVTYEARLSMLRLVLKSHQPMPVAAGQAVFDASRHNELTLINHLFDAGAAGGAVDEALHHAFRDVSSGGSHELIETLIKGGADVNVRSGTCFMTAIKRKDIRALNALLSGIPSARSLTAALSLCLPVERSDADFTIMKALITSGASGEPVNVALLDVLDSAEDAKRFRKLLLDDGKADVNFQNGEAICRVVKTQDVVILQSLLPYRLAQPSIDNALSEAMKLSDRPKRLKICQLLTDQAAGASRDRLNRVLVETAKLKRRDNDLVSLFLENGASVDHDSGSALQSAISRGDLKLLALLLRKKANADTLSHLLSVALRLVDEELRLDICTLLLGTNTPLSGHRLGSLLHKTVNSNAPEDTRVLKLFLESSAIVDQNAMNAIENAILGENLAVLNLLVAASTDGATMKHAFHFAWTEKHADLELLKAIAVNGVCSSVVDFSQYLLLATERTPISIPLLEFLLLQGASPVHARSQSLRNIASQYNERALVLILPYVKPRRAVSTVFDVTMKLPQSWTEEKAVSTIRILLENGAHGDPVDDNLILAVERYTSHNNAAVILDILIEHGASCDYRNGLGLELATGSANLTLVRTLLKTNPSRESLSNALPYVFQSSAKESTILELIDVLTQGGELDMNATHKELDPVNFLCLRHPSTTVSSLASLVKHGATTEQTIEITLEAKFGPEQVNCLLWVLWQPEGKNYDDIIDLLIEKGSNLTFTSIKSLHTPLHASIMRSRSHAFNKLVTLSSNVSITNRAGLTPLHMASYLDATDMMRTLIKAGANIDDGSLHGSALASRIKSVELLLDAGHNPNYPSPLFDSRNVLELIVRHPTVSQDQSTAIRLLKLLAKKGANVQYRNEEKSLLIIALDMHHAISIVPALLSAFMEKHTNEKFNLYKENGYVYSPYSYLVHEKQSSDLKDKAALMRALASAGFQPIYYHETGPQPADYVNAPEDIDKKEKERRRHEEAKQREEEEHQLVLRHKRESAAESQRLSQQAHEMTLAREAERSSQAMELVRKASVQEESLARHRRDAELAHQENRDRLRLATVREENRLALDQQKHAALQEQMAADARSRSRLQMLEYERQGQREAEAADQRGHQRRLREIEASRAAAGDTAREQRMLLDQQQRVLEYKNQITTNMRQIGWSDDHNQLS